MKITRINGHSIASSEIDENSVVIDLGANIGKFSAAFHARFGSRTIAIEPSTDHRAQLINDAIRVIRDDVA